MESKNPLDNVTIYGWDYFDYNNGISVHNGVKTYRFEVSHGNNNSSVQVGFNHDYDPNNLGCLGAVSWGVYKLICHWTNPVEPNTNGIDSCTLEWDFTELPGDIHIQFVDVGNVPLIRYYIRDGDSVDDTVNITPQTYQIKRWIPNGPNPAGSRRKNYGDFIFKTHTDSNYNYDLFPLDSRINCNITNQNHVEQNQVFPLPKYIDTTGEYEYYFDDRQGNLTLNLTIQKNVHSPTSLFTTIFPGTTQTYTANPSNIVIFDSVFLAIDKGTSAPIVLTLDKILEPSGINDGTDIIVKPSAKLILKHSDVYSTHAELKVRTYCNVFVNPYGTLKIERYGNVVLEAGGKMKLEENSIVEAETQGEIILNSGGTLLDCGANFINNPLVCILVNNGGVYTSGGSECNKKVIHTVNNGAFIVVAGGNLNIGDSSKIIFDGATSYLDVKAGSTITMGNGASIEFKNGAYLNAHGATFNSYNNNSLWEGIVFENSGKDSVVNCTFSNAVTSLKILNSNSYATQLRLIKNNTFNVPAGGKYGIYTLNCVNINLQDNTFNMPVSSGSSVYMGAYLRNNFTGVIAFEQGEGAGDDGTMLNVVHNTFNNGTASLMIDNLISSYLPFYIANNTFYNSSSFNLLLLKSNGKVKNNYFTSLNIGICMFSSSPDFSGNAVTTEGINIQTNGYSYPNLSPVKYDNHLIWYGGKNTLQSESSDNIHLFTGGNVYTDLGHNLFITDDTAGYHI